MPNLKISGANASQAPRLFGLEAFCIRPEGQGSNSLSRAILKAWPKIQNREHKAAYVETMLPILQQRIRRQKANSPNGRKITPQSCIDLLAILGFVGLYAYISTHPALEFNMLTPFGKKPVLARSSKSRRLFEALVSFPSFSLHTRWARRACLTHVWSFASGRVGIIAIKPVIPVKQPGFNENWHDMECLFTMSKLILPIFTMFYTVDYADEMIFMMF